MKREEYYLVNPEKSRFKQLKPLNTTTISRALEADRSICGAQQVLVAALPGSV